MSAGEVNRSVCRNCDLSLTNICPS